MEDRQEDVEFIRIALSAVQIGVNYCQADLIKRTLDVLEQKKGDFTTRDASFILSEWEADWDEYFESNRGEEKE